MAVDGTLKFDTKIDTDGVSEGVVSVKEVINKLIKSLENLAGAVTKAFNNISVGTVTNEVKEVEQSVDNATESIVDMSTDVVQAVDTAEASVNKLDNALDNIKITMWDDVESDAQDFSSTLDSTESAAIETAQAVDRVVDSVADLNIEIDELDDIPIEEMTESASQLNNMFDLIKRSINSIPNILAIIGDKLKNAFTKAEPEIVETQNEIQELVHKIDTYKDAMHSMESQGLYFGDEAYDKAYSELSAMEAKLKEYKNGLRVIDGGNKTATKSTEKLGKTISSAGKNMDKTKKKATKLSKTLSMLGKSLMFSVVFRAFQSVTNAIKEGFQNLAQASPKTNESISALATSLQTLKNSFATAFSPILTAITPALQTLIGYLSQAVTAAGQFFAVFLNGSTTFTKAKDAQIDYAKSLKQSAKEADKSLSSIDKLNNTTDSGSNTGNNGPVPTDMFEEVQVDSKLVKFVENLKKKLEPTIKAFDRLKVAISPFAKNVGKGLKWFYVNALLPLANWSVSSLIPGFLDVLGASIGVLNSVIEVFKPYALWLWESFLKPIAQWAGGTIIEGLRLLVVGLNLLSNWIMNNQELVAVATIAIASFFLAFNVTSLVAALVPFISTLTAFITSGTLLSSVLGAVSAGISALFAPITLIVAALGFLVYTFIDLYKNSESFRESIAELGRTWMDALEPLATFVGTVLTDAWDKILKPIISFFIDTLIPNLIDTFKNLWEKVLVPLADFIGTVLKPVFQIIVDLLTLLWKKVVLPLADCIGTVFKAAWKGLYEILNKTIIPIIKAVIQVLEFLWKKVIEPIVDILWDVLKPAFDTVFSGIGEVIKGLKVTLKGIIEFIVGVFTLDWERAWQGIKDIFKGIFDSLVGVVKTPMNLIIDIINGMIKGIITGVNTVIKAINSISFEIPSWLGGGKVGFNLKTLSAPQIPKLATGAVIPPNSEFLAILGDQKKGVNIEAPLETILEAFRQANDEKGANGGVIDLTLNLDGRTLLKRLIELAREHKDMTGKLAFD